MIPKSGEIQAIRQVRINGDKGRDDSVLVMIVTDQATYRFEMPIEGLAELGRQMVLGAAKVEQMRKAITKLCSGSVRGSA